MIKAYYCNSSNYGDTLTPYLLKQFWNLDITHTDDVTQADLIGIGSILENCTKITQPTAIWGSGFMRIGKPITPPPQATFLAVRGNLSKNRIPNFDGPVGDPGLLVSKIIPSPTEKVYHIGFIPHYIDWYDDLTKYIKSLPNIHYINVAQSPETFILEVTKCNYILSSSLHGLITADSFQIPNLHVILSDKVWGNNYKFQDYYSAFNRIHKFLDIRHFINRFPNFTAKHLVHHINSTYRPIPSLAQIQNNLTRSFEQYFIKKEANV